MTDMIVKQRRLKDVEDCRFTYRKMEKIRAAQANDDRQPVQLSQLME